MANRIDSRLLCALLHQMSDGKYQDEIGLYDKNFRNRFSKGSGNTCYWPPHDSWFYSLRSEEGDQADHFDPHQMFPLSGRELKKAIAELKIKERDLPNYDWQITLQSKIYIFMMRLFRDEFYENQDQARNLILETCTNFGLDHETIRYINSLHDYSAIIKFLIRRAKDAAGKPKTISRETLQTQSKHAKILPIDHWEQSVTYRQLSHNDQLSVEQLREISRLVWETDPYIFPAVFSLEQTIELLPLMFASNKDCMFSLDNIYAGFIGDNVVSILLHKKGPLNWSSEYLVKLAGIWNVNLPKTLKKAEKEYFSKYDQVDPNTTSILNICLAKELRKIDEKYGGLVFEKILKNFLQEHDETCELYALKETDNQVMAYFRVGFEIIDSCNGFSTDNHILPCFFMRRIKQY